jgi:hypothetical protein
MWIIFMLFWLPRANRPSQSPLEWDPDFHALILRLAVLFDLSSSTTL